MEKTSFDLDVVPREIRDDLARSLASRVDTYFKQPGVEAEYQLWLVEYEKRKSAGERQEHK